MTDTPLDYELSEDDENALFAEDEQIKLHVHTLKFENMSLVGAVRCNRCGSYVAGSSDMLDNHDRLHEQLDVLAEALLALNGDVREPGASSKKEKKKGKKHA